MTRHARGYASPAESLAARIGLVALRLSIEVNRLRAMRGDGREDRFAGVLMRDADIAALCAELIAAPLPETDRLTEALAEAEARHAVLCAASPSPPVIERLAPLYGLNPAEAELLFHCCGAGLDPRLARVLAYLHEDMARPYLTLGLAQRLFAALPGGEPAALWGALSEEGALIRHGLMERAEGHVAEAALRVPDWLIRLVLSGPSGLDLLDQLPIPKGPDDQAQGPLLIEARQGIDALVALGPVGPTWIAEGCGVARARQLGVIAALYGHRQIITESDDLLPTERRALLRSLGTHSILVSRRPALWFGMGVALRHRTAARASHSARLSFWASLGCPARAPILAEEQVARPGRLWRLAQEAADPEALHSALRHDRSEPMQGLADHILPRFGFDALELPTRSLALLRGFAARRARERKVLEDWGLGAILGAGRGAIALFLGPSGTGKTMAASVVAQAAGLDLWRINLASTVSKYIGETEANLDRIFRAADQAEVMLFFDEAEALFSRRAEVKEARDRYANMEMAYLLQRIEDFRGMAVLASNMGNSLEPAMLRRFDLVLDFALPDQSARRRLWARIEAGRVPLGPDVNLDLLAERFDLAGGQIRQAILSAAHDAAEDGTLCQVHLLRAVAREYLKLGRPLRREDFGTEFPRMRG